MSPPFYNRRLNVVGAVGYLCLAIGLVAAYSNPASEYELSLYWSTPLWYWLGVSVAFAASLIVSFSTIEDEYRLLGTILGGMASASVVSLPIIRGYFSHGIYDSVTHVGWARELAAGSSLPVDVFYPGIHSVAVFIHELAGIGLWQSLLYPPLLVTVVFYVFVALTVRELVNDERATTVGAFSAFLLVPIHMLANTTHPHPSSQAIMFTPLLLFLIVRYLGSAGLTERFGLASPIGVTLFLSVVSVILYHPQQALNVLLLLGVICLIQYLARSRQSVPWSNHREMYSVTVASVAAFFGWTGFQAEFFLPVVAGAVQSLWEAAFGATGSTGTDGSVSFIAGQSSALQEVGSGLLVVFFKLFFVSTIFITITGVVLLAAFTDRLDPVSLSVDVTVVQALGLGLFPMLLVFFGYFFGDVGAYYFREAGFMLMVGTIFGAVGITCGARVLSNWGYRRVTGLLLVCSFAVLLPLSTMVLYSSPYIHKSNQHVTEARVDAYDASFEMTNESAVMAGVRQNPERYYNAIVSMQEVDRLDENINSTEITQLRDQREGPWYLMMHANTYEREIEAYEEYRYSRADLTGVRRQHGVHRVFANGDAELYYIP